MLRRRGALAVLLLATVLGPIAPAGAEPEPEARTLAAWPHTALVHGQEIRVRGTGWLQSDTVVIGQCAPGADDLFEDCESEVDFVRPGPGGGFRYRWRAEVILDLETPVDCRVTACEIVAWRSFEPDEALRTPLTFDPGGPDPTTPTLAAQPAADLVDGQTVHVTGDGYVQQELRQRNVSVKQCRATFGAWGSCDPRDAFLPFSEDGHLDADLTVRARLLPLAGPSVDCRVEACVLVVDQTGEASEAASFPLSFDPGSSAADPPTVTVGPADDLVDGQRIDIDGEGLFPEDEVFATLCPADAGPNARRCADLVDSSAVAGADGTFHTTMRVRTVFTARQSDTSIDCRTEACEVRVGFAFGQDQPEAFPLTFDPDAPLLQPRLHAQPHVDLVARRRITVTGREFSPYEGALLLTQCVGRPQEPGWQWDQQHCDLRRDRVIDTGADFSVRFGVRRHLRTRGDGDVDCRFRRCYVVGSEYLGALGVPSERLLFRAGG